MLDSKLYQTLSFVSCAPLAENAFCLTIGQVLTIEAAVRMQGAAMPVSVILLFLAAKTKGNLLEYTGLDTVE